MFRITFLMMKDWLSWSYFYTKSLYSVIVMRVQDVRRLTKMVVQKF